MQNLLIDPLSGHHDCVVELTVIMFTLWFIQEWYWVELQNLEFKTQHLLVGGRERLKDVENSETQKLEIAIGDEPVSGITHTKYFGIEADQLFLPIV